MKIALVNENSQVKKNKIILEVLEKVCQKYHYEVYNYGASLDKNADIDYVGAGVLTGILLASGAVDFVITGCASGEGVLMSSNMMPQVFCGYVSSVVDAFLFQKVNGGNAVSIPFGKSFGVGYEYQLEKIFETLFETKANSGYPRERKEIQDAQREKMTKLKWISSISMENILEQIDKDTLYKMIKNDYFEEHFFQNAKNDRISTILKDIIDAWEV